MTITISDFNATQARIARVMGVGDGDYGYGQQTLSGPQDPQTGELVWATYDNLRTDILAARYHQIGNTSLPIPYIESPAIPSAEIWSSMKSVLTQVENSRTAVPPSDQLFRVNLATGIITSEWNTSTVHTVSVVFESATAMRNYFNTGSSVEFSASRAGGAITGKQSSWTSLLNGMGIISVRQGSTRSSTSLSAGIGFAGLTTTDQVIFQKYAAETAYVQNSYTILAKITSANDLVSNAITFTITFADDANVAIENDPNISGTLTSSVNAYHAVGSYVTVMPPIAINSVFTAGAANPSFTIDRDSATISEGLTGVTFTVTSANFNNTQEPVPVYWKIVGTGITANDFEETKDTGTLTGQFDIINNVGTFTLNATADALTEGTEKFNIELRTTPTGPVIASIANALQQILDLSKVAVNVILPATYTFLSLTKTIVPEGDLVSFTLVTTNVPDNTQIYWTTRLLSSGLTADDFNDGKLDGIVTVSGNVATIDRLLVKTDAYDEGIESFQLQVYSIVNGVKSLKAASNIVQITDTIAALPDVPYTVVSNNFVTSVQEGSTSAVVFKIGTPKLPANTRLYWLIVGELGTITSSDFQGNTLTGSVLVNSQTASLSLYAASDNATEGLEKFKVYFYRDVERVDQVLESDVISITETVPYTITRTTASMAEGGSGIIFTVTTPFLSNQATELYWTTVSSTGNITADDFEDGQMSGSVWVTNATGIVIRRARIDLATEGSEQFYLELRATPGTSGPLLASSVSQLVTITENVQYTISPSSTTMLEGAVGVTFAINTPKLPSGTLVYWETVSTNGIVNSSDFTDNKTAGTVTVTDNSAVLVRTAVTDSLTEGNESFQIKLRYPANASGTVVATSDDITISELVPYRITPSTNLITEGSTAIQFNISTPKVPTNTVLKWKLVAIGNITDADVTVSDSQSSGSPQRLTGEVAIGSNNRGSFSITARQDNLVEDQEGFKIELLDQEDEVLATSAVVNIKDVSPYRMEFSTGTPTVTVWEGGLDSSNQVAEDAATINIYTPWLADGTELYWTTVASMGSINASDFTDNVLQGKVVIYSNQGQIIRRVAADKLTEGGDAFYIRLHETSYTSPPVAASGIVIVTNTSNTPEVPEPIVNKYTVQIQDNITSVTEGDSVTFHVETVPPVATGTDLYWSLYKGAGVTADDFALNAGSPTSGLFHVNAQGWADITITTVADQSLEGTESFLFQVHEVSAYTMPKIASPVVTITDAVQYSVTSAKSMEENSSAVTFTVKTPKAGYGQTLVWSVVSDTGPVTASDFVENTMTGPVSISSTGVGTFTLTAADDQLIEGTESFHIVITKNGDTVATGWPISITELAAYTLNANVLIVDEGQPVTYTINTPKLSGATQYTWTAVKDSGNTLGISPTTGNFTVSSGQTTAQFLVISTANNTAEGTRSYHLEIVKTSTGQPIVITGTNPIVTIKETVTTVTYVPAVVPTDPPVQVVTVQQAIPYLIKLPQGAPSSVVGGDPDIVFLVSTPAIADTDLTWELVSTITGKVTIADVSATSGTVSISANSGSFTISPLQNPDSIDTSKTFTVRLRRASGELIALGSSAPLITITKPVAYTYTVLPSSIKEGGTRLTVTVHTPAESASQTLNWAINTLSGTVEAVDFVGNTLTGTVSINSSGTGTFYVSAATDDVIEASDSFNFTFTKASGDSITFGSSPTVTILDVQAAAGKWLIDVQDEPRLSVREKGSKAFTVTAPVGFTGSSIIWRLVGDNLSINSRIIGATGVLNGSVVFQDPTQDPKIGIAMVKLDNTSSPLKVGSQFHIELVSFLGSNDVLPIVSDAPIVTVVEVQPSTVAVSITSPDAPSVEISKTTVKAGQNASFTLQLPQGESITTAWWQIVGNVPSSKVNGTMFGTVEIDPLTYSGTVTVSLAAGSTQPVQQSFMVKFYRTSLMQAKDEVVIKAGSPTVQLAFDEVLIVTDTTPYDPKTADPTEDTGLVIENSVIVEVDTKPKAEEPVIVTTDTNETVTVMVSPTPIINVLSYPGTLKEGNSVQFKIIVQNTTKSVDVKWVVRAPASETLGGISGVYLNAQHVTTGSVKTELISTSTKLKHGISTADLSSYEPLKCTIISLKLYTKKASGVDICGPFNVEFSVDGATTVTTTDIVISDVAVSQTFKTSGLWTVPKNCTQVTIKAAGGGGGAAGYDNYNLQYLGGNGGDTATMLVNHRLPAGTKSLKVTVAKGGGAGSHRKAAGTGGTGYRAGGAGGQYRSIGGSGSGGGGGGGTAIEAILTNGKSILLAFVPGGGGGGGGSLNQAGENGTDALLNNNTELSYIRVGETGLKQTLDGGTGGGGGAGGGTYGKNGKDKATGGEGGKGGLVYCNPDTQVAAPVITRVLGSGGVVKAKGIASPGLPGEVTISTIPGDCRAETITLPNADSTGVPLDVGSTSVATPPDETSLDPNMFRKNGTWTTPAGVSKVRFTATAGGSSVYAMYSAVNNNNNPLVVKSGASGATIQWTEPTVEGDVFDIVVGQAATTPVPLMNRGRVAGQNGSETILRKNGNVVFNLGGGTVSVSPSGVATAIGGKVVTKPAGISSLLYANGFSMPVGKDTFTQQFPTPDTAGSKLPIPDAASWWYQYDKAAVTKQPTIPSTGRSYLKFPSTSPMPSLKGKILPTRLGLWEYGGGLLVEPMQGVVSSTSGGVTGGNTKAADKKVELVTVTTVIGGSTIVEKPVSGTPTKTPDATAVKFTAAVSAAATVSAEAAIAKFEASAKSSKDAKTLYEKAVSTQKSSKAADTNATIAFNNAKKAYDTAFTAVTTAQKKWSDAKTATAKAAAQKAIDTAQKNLKTAQTKYELATDKANISKETDLNAIVSLTAAKQVYEKMLAADAATKNAATAAATAATTAAAQSALSATIVASPSITVEAAVAKLKASVNSSKTAKTAYDKAVNAKKSANTASNTATKAFETAKTAAAKANDALNTAQKKLNDATTPTAKAAAQKAVTTAKANVDAATKKVNTAVASANKSQTTFLDAGVNEQAAKMLYDEFQSAAANATVVPTNTKITTQSISASLTSPIGTVTTGSKTVAGKTTITKTTVVAKPAVLGKPNVSLVLNLHDLTSLTAPVQTPVIVLSWPAVEAAGTYTVQVDIKAAYPTFDAKNAIKGWTTVAGTSIQNNSADTAWSTTNWTWNPVKAAGTINNLGWQLLSYKITFTANPSAENVKSKAVKLSKTYTVATVSGKTIKRATAPKTTNILY